MTRRIFVPLLLLLLSAGGVRAQETEGVRVTSGGVLVDFQDADLRLVISALAEAGGLNVVYSDIPPKRVTMRMGQPVARESVLPLLRSIAASNGLSLTEEGGFIRVEQAGSGQTPRAAAGAEPEGPGSELRLFVHRLRHVRADRLAATLQSVFGGRSAPGQGAGLSRAPLSQALREQRIPPTDPEAPPVAVEVLAGGPSLPGQLQGEVQIVPDEVTNSLLVRAQAGDWEVIRQAVEALDLRPLQVVIEGLIVEVRRSREVDVGVSARVSALQLPDGSRTREGVFNGRTTGEFAFELKRLGGIDLDVALSVLSSTGRVRILSTPIIQAQNSQEARILIGAQRPFIQVFRALPTDAAVRDQVVQYRDVGTSLTIRPTINPDGYVNLQLTQEVSNATSETQFGAPVISTREASTHLFVKDGQTVVIGGLSERQEDRSRIGIPFLKDIPVLGMLFGRTRNAGSRSELFLFLTPHIVETDEDAAEVLERVEQGTELLREQLRGSPSVLTPGAAKRESSEPPEGT